MRTGVSKGQKGGTTLTNHLNSHSKETHKLSFCLYDLNNSQRDGHGVPDQDDINLLISILPMANRHDSILFGTV